MLQVGYAGQVQQHECKLKRIPGAVYGDVDIVEAVLDLSLPLAHLFSKNGTDPLPAHRLVGESKGFSRVRVVAQEVNARPDSLQGPSALPYGLPGRILMCPQQLFRLSNAFFFSPNPFFVSVRQYIELFCEVPVRGNAKLAHVQDETRELGIIGNRRRRLPRHFVVRHRLGLYANSTLRVIGVNFSMNANTMANSKLDLMAIEHVEGVHFHLGRYVNLARVHLSRVAFAENRGSVRRFNHKLSLKQPGLIFAT